MKINSIKPKVEKKVEKCKIKIAAKCKTAAKSAALFAAISVLVAGCSTADAPTAQRAQTVTAKDISIVVNMSGTNATPPALTIEIATAAQANETSGTETNTATPTQTPTTDVKPTTTVNYGLTSASTGGSDWISQLTSASAKGLAEWLKGGEDGNVTVTKKDGTTETVACKDGSCTTCDGDCVECSECSE